MNDNTKKTKVAVPDLMLGIAAIVLGAILLIFPSATISIVLNGIGIAVIVIGIISIIRYLVIDSAEATQSNGFAYGMIYALAGLVLIVFKKSFIELMPLCIGFVIMIGGCFKLQGGIAALRAGSKWIPTVVAAAISLIGGGLIVFNPFSTAMVLMRVIGIGLIYEGIVDYAYVKLSKKENKNVIETTATDL